MKRDNIIRDKTYAFASRIIKVYKSLSENKREFVLSRQLLRSGTSIGANVEEAMAASSKADFANKLNIASKEARETAYWLRLLHDNEYLTKPQFDSLFPEIEEIKKVISSILMTLKESGSSNS